MFRPLLLACPLALLGQIVTPPVPSVAPAKEGAPAASTPAQPEQVIDVPQPGRFKALFQPVRTDRAALSPDGKYLAYSIRENDTVAVAVIEIDHPEKMKEVAAIAKTVAEKTKAGDPRAADTNIGPVVNRIQWDKIQGLIKKGIEEGATLAINQIDELLAAQR